MYHHFRCSWPLEKRGGACALLKNSLKVPLFVSMLVKYWQTLSYMSEITKLLVKLSIHILWHWMLTGAQKAFWRMKKPSVYGSPMEGTLHPGEKFFWRCCFWCSMQISGGPIFQDPCPRSHGWRKKESRWLWYGGKFSGCRLRSAYQLYLSEDHGSWNSEEVLEVLSCGIPKRVTFTARNEKPVRTESYWEERMDRQSFMPRTEEEVDGSSLATSFLTIGDEIWNPSGA